MTYESAPDTPMIVEIHGPAGHQMSALSESVEVGRHSDGVGQVRGRIAPGQQGDPGRRANRRRAVGAVEMYPLPTQTIEMRRVDRAEPLQSKMIEALLVGRDEEDVRTGHGEIESGQIKQGVKPPLPDGS